MISLTTLHRNQFAFAADAVRALRGYSNPSSLASLSQKAAPIGEMQCESEIEENNQPCRGI